MLAFRKNFPKYAALNILKRNYLLQKRSGSSSASSLSQQVRINVLNQLSVQSSKWKLSPGNIEAAVKECPQLLKYAPSEWDTLRCILSEIGFNSSEFLQIVIKCPDLLVTNHENIKQVWHALQIFRLPMQSLMELVVSKPYLLCTPHQSASDKSHAILNFVGGKANALRVLTNCNNVFTLSLVELSKVIEYVQEEMKVRRTHEICRSRVVECPLLKLKMRHSFLVLCGLYVPQDDDIPLTVRHTNPLLSVIVDTSDAAFAKQAAKLTAEEYIVYKDLCEKQYYEDIYEDEDDD